MSKRGRRRGPPIHPSIKERLGYDREMSDSDVYDDWRERTSRVCKPCWELKYCPYGPLVEQLPTLPPLRLALEEQQSYFKRCLETNTVGEVGPLSNEMREIYSGWLGDEDLLRRQALTQLRNERRLEQLNELETEEERLAAWSGGELPPPHIYRVRYDLGLNDELEEADLPPEVWREILTGAEAQRVKLKTALETGVDDTRAPLEPVRREWFEKRVAEFSPEDYPEAIPATFEDGECSIFGHICPVFFVAEAMTETEEERRIGRRRLTFETMMRIVRRDDYRCQHCRKKLEDNEVEFDHKIPVSKGGSSEEHNLRLTCFDCNRDKGDDYAP